MSASQPYQHPQHPLFHTGVVSVTGTTEVDLGIRHTNFDVKLSLVSSAAGDANAAAHMSWEKVAGRPGVFLISTWKATTGGAAGNPTLIAATAAVNISFFAIVGASVA